MNDKNKRMLEILRNILSLLCVLISVLGVVLTISLEISVRVLWGFSITIATLIVAIVILQTLLLKEKKTGALSTAFYWVYLILAIIIFIIGVKNNNGVYVTIGALIALPIMTFLGFKSLPNRNKVEYKEYKSVKQEIRGISRRYGAEIRQMEKNANAAQRTRLQRAYKELLQAEDDYLKCKKIEFFVTYLPLWILIFYIFFASFTALYVFSGWEIPFDWMVFGSIIGSTTPYASSFFIKPKKLKKLHNYDNLDRLEEKYDQKKKALEDLIEEINDKIPVTI